MVDYAALLAALTESELDASDVVDFTGVHATESPVEGYQYRLFLVESLTYWVDIKEAVFPPNLDAITPGQVTIWVDRNSKVQYGELTRADATAASFLAPLDSWEDAFSDEFALSRAEAVLSGRGTCRELSRPRPPSGRGGCIASGRGGCRGG